MAALRFSVMGTFALAEGSEEDARPYFAQALSAYSLIGDTYQTTRHQERLARLEQTQRTTHAHTLLDSASATLDRLPALSEWDRPQAKHDAETPENASTANLYQTTFGASLAHAALSIDLIAEAWLQAARPLLPDRWIGIYRCEEGHPWTCVRELGKAPAVPTTHEPCGPRLQNDDVYWVRLRSHPGPAFFFGIALPDPEDPAWKRALTQKTFTSLPKSSARNITGRRSESESFTGGKSSGWAWPGNGSADREIGQRWTIISPARPVRNP
jgi:hypothetical protein